MKIGERIAIARKNAGLTQTDVAKKLNLSVSMVSAWESGIRTPKLDTIVRICNAIGCDTSEILNTVDFSTNAETEVEEHKLLCPMKKGSEENRVCDKERCAWYFPSSQNCAVAVMAASISGHPREGEARQIPVLKDLF